MLFVAIAAGSVLVAQEPVEFRLDVFERAGKYGYCDVETR